MIVVLNHSDRVDNVVQKLHQLQYLVIEGDSNVLADFHCQYLGAATCLSFHFSRIRKLKL
jgi:hypothetical protein